MTPRPRKRRKDLPMFVQESHGSLYHVRFNKWTRLCKGVVFTAAAAQAYAKLTDTPTSGGMGALFDEYEREIVPRTAKGMRYTDSGFKANWQRLMRRYADAGGERFRFHDLRAKAGSESEDDRLLGHTDRRTLERHYKRRPDEVRALEVKR